MRTPGKKYSEIRPGASGIREGRFCKCCGAPLDYDVFHFGQMGIYHCSGCGFHRPAPEYSASGIRYLRDGSLSFDLSAPQNRETNNREEAAPPPSTLPRAAVRRQAKDTLRQPCDKKRKPAHFDTGFRGLYNLYNILAVWSVLQDDKKDENMITTSKNLTRGICFPENDVKKPAADNTISGADLHPGVNIHPNINLHSNTNLRANMELHSTSSFRKCLRNYHTQFGRNEVFFYRGRRIVLNLAKNPAGFNQNIDAMLLDRHPKDLVIAINDNAQDGIDVSWLWDVDFDRLADKSVRSILVSGTRALDMQLRLKYAGIKSEVMKTPEEAILAFLSGRNGSEGSTDAALYVLVNYTALMPAHTFLQKICSTRGRRGKTDRGAVPTERGRTMK